MTRINWPALMTAGLQGTGLRPREFWDLTPAELLLLLDAGTCVPLNRSGLDSLLERFPDKTSERNGDG